ncbi:phosphoribosyltransferase-like protein [Bradyrhizobium sp. CCGE-LA001]|uniref:phosphoribosyltransferase-like protein n=1 Tax=Bradyrhizobium sp. CCGE-LA001 TaxID=1223566 RepID=UPI0002AA70C0|nr:hypothetical protein [Bradyrhizobium sp. CCGE-LA001]AMA60047.1 hypothetical protein BCCGELA001_29955 [Bradyrhizobium sp. CCGE-LA001]
MTRSLALRLPDTADGQAWINQFDALDRELARQLLESLVLVSSLEFERRLISLLASTAQGAAGPTAFFAAREWDGAGPYLMEDEEADAVGPGGDIGSEGRVAAIIRGLCRTHSSQLLNHPSIRQMLDVKCRLIVLVDDFVGSGQRIAEFHAALWANRTIRSWHSFGWIKFALVAYSATDRGRARVSRLLDLEPQLVRGCPTFQELPVTRPERAALMAALKRYAKRTDSPGIPLRYDNTGSVLVFEHGCADNVPPVFWAKAGSGKIWKPLFPKRSVLPGAASAFPAEFGVPSASAVLQGAGQGRLATSGALSRRGAIGETILVLLGLVAKRVRKRSALAHATGLTIEECTKIIERCISWRLLTPALRITDRGHAELDYARRKRSGAATLPTLGSDEYYPKQLRGSGHG